MSFATRHQDWGGRRKANPDNAPRVTRQQVIDMAYRHDIEIKRASLGMWFYKNDCTWYTLGQTNYLALRQLRQMVVDAEANGRRADQVAKRDNAKDVG